MRWFIYVCLLALVVSCSPRAEKEKEKVEKAEAPQERVISADEAIGGLPCFKCHSYRKFSAHERGVFPHIVHASTGYHCNQCHSFKGHSLMKVNTSLCNDCHKLKAFVFAASGFPAKFNHESHAKIGCKDCHTGIFPMKKGTSRITMEAIYQGRYCGACHNGKRAFASSECGACHELKTFKKPVSYKVEGVGNVVFGHEFHSQIFGCDTCHPKFFAMKRTEKKMTMDAMYAGKYCGACHNGEKAFPSTDCGKCHKG